MANAGTTNVTVQNSSFLGAYQYNFDYELNDAAAGDFVLSGNKFRDTQSNTSNTFYNIRMRADAATHAAAGTLTYTISNNDLRDAQQAAIYLAKGDGTPTITGSITGNVIGNAGVTNSGSAFGEGIRVEHSGQGKHKLLIDNNQIFQYNNVGGISLRMLSAIAGVANNGSMHATITRNTLSNPGTNNAGGIIDGVHIDPGTASGTAYTFCANFGHAGGANTIVNGGRAADGGLPFSIGPVTPTTNPGFLKLLGLAGSPFTGHAGESPADNLISADNGLSPGNSFFDLGNSLTTTVSTDNARGVACDLP